MPKTRFDRVPRDPLKELVLGRKAALDMSLTRLAEKMHITRSQLSTILEKPSANWTIGNAIALTAALDIPIAEMRGAHKIIERIKCAPAVEPIYIHKPTKSEFKRMAAQLGYEQVVRCKDCEYSYDDISSLCCSHGICVDCEVPPNFYCAEGKRKESDE